MKKEIQPMFYVVSRAMAAAMTGGRGIPQNGTMYGTFSTLARAEAFQKNNGLGLCSKVVEL